MAKNLTKKRKKEPVAAPDEFLSWSARLLLWSREHIWALTLALLVLLTAGGAYSYYQYWQQQRQEKAAELLQASLRRQSDPASLRQELEVLLKDYPGTGAALQARLALADLLFREGQYLQAAAQYEALAAAAPALKELTAENISLCYEMAKDYRRALAALEPLLEQPGLPWRQELQLRRARLLELAGDREQALNIYQELAQQQPSPELSFYLQEKIAVLSP